ncbi:MAG: tRNA (guanosine(37)-N1)-methyltransferase TrmD [Bacillota bacterium]|nr:tRNA (guanosine(37)-N1)-methyltransferase TrmD [Bacillota bacterium]
MKIDVLTLFPEMFEAVFGVSVLKNAVDNNLLELKYINIRDYSDDKHKRVDDYPYGSGGGMVMQPAPIYNAYKNIEKECGHRPYVIYMSPQGKLFDQSKAIELSKRDHMVLLCGHYEGIDQRILDEIVDEEISMGDYVLTGGEIAAMAVIDACARMVPGVLDSEETFTHESLFEGLLEYPQYTRPPEFLGREVPEILLSGHHANIERWRRQQALIVTEKKRPDLLANANLSEEDIAFLKKYLQCKENCDIIPD